VETKAGANGARELASYQYVLIVLTLALNKLQMVIANGVTSQIQIVNILAEPLLVTHA
jgi:hypothetical protein